MNERLSVAPMLDCTTRHYRFLLRGITRRTVLYSEMVVDSTLLHQRHCLAPFLRHDFQNEGEEEGAQVLQLGGFDPHSMAEAAGLASEYAGARYAEMNINCGCPSAKVVGKCFGAKLMLDPPLVRRIASQMQRRVGHHCPITVKCRIGADERDKYEHLCEFINEVRSAGVRKFIGLSTKQNRSVPPLQYEVVHRLVTEYPDLQFVLNGGLGSMQQVDAHLGLGPLSCGEVLHSQPLSDYGEENGWGQPVHGCMVGRAVYTNPFMFSQADTRYFGASSDPNLTRGQVLERYFDYCDRVMQEGMEGSGLCDPNPEEQDLVDAATMDVGSRGKSSDDGKVKIGKLLDAAKNVFHGCKGAGRYRQRLKEIYSHSARRRRAGGAFVLGEEVEGCEIDPVRIIKKAIDETIHTDDLNVVPEAEPDCG